MKHEIELARADAVAKSNRITPRYCALSRLLAVESESRSSFRAASLQGENPQLFPPAAFPIRLRYTPSVPLSLTLGPFHGRTAAAEVKMSSIRSRFVSP